MLLSCLPRRALGALVLAATTWLVGCAAPQPQFVQTDYTAFHQAQPRSIVVLPPVVDIAEEAPHAAAGLLPHLHVALSEAGYYVLPPAVVMATLAQHGLTDPAAVYALPAAQLQQLFGVDAALKLQARDFGVHYQVLVTLGATTVEAQLLDVRSDTVLWNARASAHNKEKSLPAIPLLGTLIRDAVVDYLYLHATDAMFQVAENASHRLASPGQPGGVMQGPHRTAAHQAAQAFSATPTVR